MPWNFDNLIIGAGFAGIVLAERLASQLGQSCLIVDKRDHIGGNCFDEYDAHGVLVHRYGPHYFRTNSPRILDYLSSFTAWNPTVYRVKSFTDGKFYSFPINLQTFEEMTGRTSSESEFAAYLEANRLPIAQPANSEEVILSQVGRELFEKFFRGYTLKQWRKEPRELDASVCGRIPVRTNRDDRYLREDFQALPREGYTRMFERMIRHPNIKVLLRADFREIRTHVACRRIIYTGPVDEYFNHCYGPLPYRSLTFERQSFTGEELASRVAISGRPGFWQPALQVNYPNTEAFTRIVELKHATGQRIENTTIVREYPADYGFGNDPYYPIPTPAAHTLYQKYQSLAERENNVHFVGRLATYRYYNMDQVVGMALTEFDHIRADLTAHGPTRLRTWKSRTSSGQERAAAR